MVLCQYRWGLLVSPCSVAVRAVGSQRTGVMLDGVGVRNVLHRGDRPGPFLAGHAVATRTASAGQSAGDRPGPALRRAARRTVQCRLATADLAPFRCDLHSDGDLVVAPFRPMWRAPDCTYRVSRVWVTNGLSLPARPSGFPRPCGPGIEPLPDASGMQGLHHPAGRVKTTPLSPGPQGHQSPRVCGVFWGLIPPPFTPTPGAKREVRQRNVEALR